MRTNCRGIDAMSNRQDGFSWLRAGRAALVIASLPAFVACSGILDVDLPGKVQEDALASPAMAAMLVAGAQADFECAYAEFIHTTALWSNETINSSGNANLSAWGARLNSYEEGTGTCQSAPSNTPSSAIYLPMQIARTQAEGALSKLVGYTDAQVANRTLLMARAAAYGAFASTLLGEGYCTMAVGPGPLVTRAFMFQRAESLFTSAMAYATTANNTDLVNMARVGRARVRLNLGNKTGAGADALLVPAGFSFNATYSTSTVRQNNMLVADMNIGLHTSVAPDFRNLTVGGVPDTRVPIKNMSRNGQDALTPLWIQQKYLALDTPIPMATWNEAQLIIAEVDGGQNAVDAINRIRTKYALPLYAGGTAAEIQAQVIEERRRTLWMDGHTIGDHLRYNLPFATGANHKGTMYSNNTCMPLPPAEYSGRPTS